MLAWITKKDNYVPVKDNVGVIIQRSILSFLSVTSKIRSERVGAPSFVYNVSPFTKLIIVFFVILSVSFARRPIYMLSLDVFAMLMMLPFRSHEVKNVLYVPVLASIFSFAILLPAAFIYTWGDKALLIVLKVFTTVLFLSVYVHSTEYHRITTSLKALRIPDMIILLMDITFKYIVIFGVQAVNLLTAIKLRSIGRANSPREALLNSAGVLFVKTKNSGDNLYDAMITRGFTGNYVAKFEHGFSVKDLYYTSLFVVFVLFGYII